MALYRWLILLLLAVAFLLRVDFVFYILYVAVGVYAWSWWANNRALHNLQAERHYRQRAFLGETVEVQLNLTNKSRLGVPWLQIHESIPPELRLEPSTQRALSLKGKESQSFSYHVKALQRGYYRLGPLQLSSGDLFGLVQPRHGVLPPGYLTVYPRIISLTQLGLPSRLPFGTIGGRQKLFEDPARPMGVRDFRSGDSLRQINWKASAHTQNLLVRTLEPAISLETMILLDLHSAAYERRERHYSTEWAIVTAASIATFLINQRQAVGLASNGIDPLRQQEGARVFDETTGRLLFEPEATTNQSVQFAAAPINPRSGRPHLMKILEVLARLTPRDTTPLPEWSPRVTASLGWGITVVAITAKGDAATCNALHQLTRSGYNPVLIAVEPDANFGLVRERARRLGFQAFNVSDRRDLSRWQRPLATPGVGEVRK